MNNAMTRMRMRMHALAARARAAWALRRTETGVEVTGETIGWLIAVILLVSVAVYFAATSGTNWMHQNFNSVTSISPAGVPTTVTANQ